MNKLFKQRFEELNIQADAIEKTKEYHSGSFCEGDFIDNQLLLKWKVKVEDLLLKICGEESQYFRQFQKAEEVVMGMTNYDTFKDLQSVFLAAKEDFEGGYLSSMKTLVQAEVFDSELEQAKELLGAGYLSAAAVIAGVVLETALRELCDRETIPHGKLDGMNAGLAKAGKYNKLMQKRITALADIRNSAAHGKVDEFTKQNVVNMIDEVEQFLANHLTD
jgi:dihydrofolate reductase